MPWELLELDPATATAKDVKRSYAKRLKTCRPDQDPEGFRKLHEAYSEALGQLQWRESSVDPQTPPDRPVFEDAPAASAALDIPDLTPPEFVAPPLSPGLAAVVDVMDRLESGLKNGGEGVAVLVREAEAVVRAHPSEVLRWGEILHDLIRDHGKHDDLRLKPDAILFELEQNGVAATIAVIDRLDRQGFPRGIRSLSGLFVENRKRIATPAGGIACARLAGVAAFWAPGAVEELSNLAYESLARGERDFHMEMIDHHAGMRGFLSMVPENLRSFLRQRLMNAGGSEVWDDEEGAAALRWLKTPQAKAGPVYEVIRKLLPDSVAAAAGLPMLEPETVTLSSSSASAPGPRVERRAPPLRVRLKKPADELDWEDDVEIPEVPGAPPRREAAPRASARPATGAREVSSPKPANEPTNWLDLENDPSRRASGRTPQVHSRKAGSWPNSIGAIVVLVLVAKVIITIIRYSLREG